MEYWVVWRLVGCDGRHLDSGYLDPTYATYTEAAAAANELLKLYPEVTRNDEESYWLARRSVDADLAIWVWVELTMNQTDNTGAEENVRSEA